jgi:hypothetical protein
MVAAQMVSMVLSNLDPRLAAVIGVLFALFTFNPANILTSIMRVANSLISTFSAFSQYAFQQAIESVNEQIEYYTEEIKEMKETIADMWTQGMYVPLDTMDNMNEYMYSGGQYFSELQYNPQDLIQLTLDNASNPQARLT